MHPTLFVVISLGAFASLPLAVSSLSKFEDIIDRKALHGPASGWSYVGCYSDAAASRTLLESSYVSSQMTPYLCTTSCQSVNGSLTGMSFAGVEYSKECFCDFNIQGTAKLVNDTQCNSPCAGDKSYACGGSGYISVYQDKGHNGTLPTNRNKVDGWTFQGCYKDNVNITKTVKRMLSQRIDMSTGVTIEGCISQCAAKGYRISGMEFGQECWCGSSLLIANATAPLSDCSQACKANHTELCGAANRLSVYSSVKLT